MIKDKEQLTTMYPNSFDRIGSLKGEYTIKIDPSVAPVQQARRKVPIESKEAICAALDRMIAGDILEPQIEPTPWVNNATYPVKPTREVRPCLDCIPLNKAIITENHTPPTVEEIAHELARARYFTKGDAYKAFLHVHLSKKSRELTVFGTITHGRLRYKRMPFGMKMSQDVFQIQMDRILEQCPGMIGIHDDVIIYGYTREDHDSNLINFLNVCQMKGLCLFSKKLELRRDKVSFFGAIYSREGVHPDPKKIQGTEEMTVLETKQQLQSFLGMVTYMGNFIPHLSHHTEPLRQLLKKDVTFYWDDQLTRSFQEIKHLLKKADVKAAWILRSEERSDCPGGCFSKGTGRMSHTGWQTNSLFQQVTDRSGEPLCQHRKRTARRRLCMHTVQHVSSRAQVHSSVRPQASGNDPSEEHAQHTSTSSENAPTVTEI